MHFRLAFKKVCCLIGSPKLNMIIVSHPAKYEYVCFRYHYVKKMQYVYCFKDLEEENSRNIMYRNIADCLRGCDLQQFKHNMVPISRSLEYVLPVSYICFKMT